MIAIRNARKYGGPGERICRPNPLSNPFILSRYGSRNAVCDQYEVWFKKQMGHKEGSAYKEAVRLYNLYITNGEIVLICYCSPFRCHADTIRTWLMQQEFLLKGKVIQQ